MADLSGLISRPQDVVVPLRLQTPPKPPNGTGLKQGISLPPSYAQATSIAPPIYKQTGLDPPLQQKISGNTTNSNATPTGTGTPLLNQFVTNIFPEVAAIRANPPRQFQFRGCRPERLLHRNSKFLFGACTLGLPLLLGVLAAILYLSLRPRYPLVSLETVRVWKFSALGGSNAGGLNPVLNVDLDLSLRVSNPNKRLGMTYQELEILVSFENTTLPIANLPSFFQSKKNSSVISTRVMAANAALQEDDGALMQYDIAKNDIPLRALIDVKACAQSGRWRTPSFRVHYACEFRIVPPGKSMPPLSKACKRSKEGIPDTYVSDQNLLD